MDGYTVDEIFDDIILKISNIYQKNGDIDLFIEMDYGLWDFIYRNTKINCISYNMFNNNILFGVRFFVKKNIRKNTEFSPQVLWVVKYFWVAA